MPPISTALLVAYAYPLRHAGGPDPTGPLWSDWTLQPTVVLGLFTLVVAYVWATGPGQRRRYPDGVPPDRAVSRGQRAAFLGGVLTIFVALGPPLDDWSDHYLLAAHMGQHLLLTLLAAPLLLAGTPGWLLEPLARNRVTNAVGYALTRPVPAFVLANGVFVLWHVPLFYDAALNVEPIHVMEHGLFLGTALLAWWPILGPLPAWPRLQPLPQCLYYFAQTLPGGIIGAFITFAQPGLYATYDAAPRVFGIDVKTDQEIAGLIMWVATSTLYLALITVTFFRYAGREEDRDRQHEREPRQGRNPTVGPRPTATGS